MNERNNCFLDCLDTILVVNKMARENLGEDSFFCAKKKNLAVIGVFDGCGGGLGARRYESFDGHTGAFIASRAVSGADALKNLTCDGAMNNVLSSDGNYRINYKTILLTKPALIFAATDGCFGYVSSPMEFEYILVKALVENTTPERFRENLQKELEEYAGDDLTMGIMSFFYGDYITTRKYFENRLQFLEKIIFQLWKKKKIVFRIYGINTKYPMNDI